MADVSGSMTGVPMEVCVALSLLLAETAAIGDPFRGKILTFHENPTLVDFCCEDLDPLVRIRNEDKIEDLQSKSFESKSKAHEDHEGIYSLLTEGKDVTSVYEEFVHQFGDVANKFHKILQMEWGGSTNIEAAFDKIISHACEHKIPSLNNIVLVIFSDMEFNYACNNPSQTMHKNVVEKFQSKGYCMEEGTAPKIVYWNLRDSISGAPVFQSDEKGVGMLSGFSSLLLERFITACFERGTGEGIEDNFNPVQIMLSCLGDNSLYGDRVKIVMKEESMLDIRTSIDETEY
eukprot:CAMPEP_0172514852 /NCGR_PEP_ID=MMETSP1066-20121228/263274_1 /TAXON_ID=671091 /ORGANISM="Coscinodiscus wailesii, Strain CCMP2513" /LENGTH=289 /DNA_ID=CAMNT_0013295687 /DNA_START=214 /DNA_END=1083 /DNA_ORIENTATION=-